MNKIVIMGATSGIGLAVAERLAAEGWMVGVAGRNEQKLSALQARFPDNIRCEQIDITADDAPHRLRRLIDSLGGMDTYFYVSGVGFANDHLDPALELATMRVNVDGFTRMIDDAYRYFRDECGGRGHIAAITSVAGTNGLGNAAAYSSSKRFQQTYLRALDQLAHIRHLHISFTDIRPGWIRTPLLDPREKYPMLMQLSYVVPRIIRALRRRRRVAVIDWRWNILVGLWRLIPNALWVHLRIPVGDLVSPTAPPSSK